MKRASIIAMCLVCLALSAMATVTEKETGYVSVNLSDSKEISPNQAEISFSVETTDKTLQKAVKDNNETANKIYSVLKPVLSAEDYLKTGRFSVNPQYIYTKEHKRVLDSYKVVNTVIVKTKNIEIISKLIDSALSQGATNVNNLDFSAVDYDNECEKLLSDLTKKTYQQAQTVAKSIGSNISGVKSISANCNEENSQRPYMRLMSAKAAMDSAVSTPVEAGKIKIYANISASFYVK